MTNQCSCGVPTAKGMTHRLGDPCILSDGKALLDRGVAVIPAHTTVPLGLQVPSHPATPQDLLGGMDLRAIDPQYLDVTQAEILKRATDMAQGYEDRIQHLGAVVKALSEDRKKLVALRAAVDTVINEVEAVADKSTSPTAKDNFRIITTFLRAATDKAGD
jgi:hypothetical protein